jgi:E3 ubiquitin-protein ligase HECTD2
MPPRSQRHLPIPPISTSATAAIPLYPSQTSGLELSPRSAARPRDASNMSPMNGSRPKNPNDRGHSRSISNPFAGFGRMRDKITAKNDTWDSDSDDDDEVTFPLEPESASPRKGAVRGGPGNGTDEGKCQTCDATVRWPRHLKVFRCANCLMVTDLEPNSQESKDFEVRRDKSPRGTQGGPSKLASKGNATKAGFSPSYS